MRARLTPGPRYRASFVPAGCKCAGLHNKYKEGAKCASYSGYTKAWKNGKWCFANTSECADAAAHPITIATGTVPASGYGPSRGACSSSTEKGESLRAPGNAQA